jgi:hypothetical protein
MPDDDDYATVAQRWVTRFDAPEVNSWDDAKALGASPDGSTVFVTGFLDGAFTRARDYGTVAYDAATGAQLWDSRYNGPGDGLDIALALGVSLDSTAVFVTGRSDGAISEDYATVAYDAVTGTELRVLRAEGGGGGFDAPSALGVKPDGSAIFVTGSVEAEVYDDFWTIAYGIWNANAAP